MKNIFLLILAAVLLVPTVFADTLYLKNKEKVEGRIIKSTDDYVKAEIQGQTVIYFTQEIDHIEVGDQGEEALYDEDLVDEALNLSAFSTMIIRLRAELFYCLMRYDNRLDETMAPQIELIIDSVYNEKYFRAVVKEALMESLDRPRLYNVRELLKMKSLNDLSESYKSTLSEMGRKQIKTYLDSIQLCKPSQQRLDLIERLDYDSAATQFVLDFIKVGIYTIAKGQAVSEYDIARTLKERVHGYLLFLYRDAGDSMLENHIKLAQNESLRWFNHLVRSSINEVNVLLSGRVKSSVDAYLDDIAAQKAMLESAKKKHGKKVKAKKNQKKQEGVDTTGKTLPKTNIVPASWVKEE